MMTISFKRDREWSIQENNFLTHQNVLILIRDTN